MLVIYQDQQLTAKRSNHKYGGKCMLENENNICYCKRKKCVRHGKCSECIEHHRNSKKLPLPYCKVPTFDLLNKSFGKANSNNK